jgi:uncharacterized protein (DUF169 family)
MGSLDVIHEYAGSLEKLLRLKTLPLALKLLEKEGEIPQGAKRPRRDYGYRFITCQGFSESRRAEASIVQTKDEMWCFEAAMGYGFIKPIEYFLEGNTRFPEAVVTLEVGKVWAQAFPRLEYGKYTAIVSTPLAKANFEPDLLMIYCDSIQLTQLLMARTWMDGRDITCRMSGHGACVHAVVPVIQTRECQVTFPCWGDRRRAFAQDDEIIFTAPIEKAESLIAGIRGLKKQGLGIPLVPLGAREPEMLPSYMKIAKMTGMHE